MDTSTEKSLQLLQRLSKTPWCKQNPLEVQQRNGDTISKLHAAKRQRARNVEGHGKALRDTADLTDVITELQLEKEEKFIFFTKKSRTKPTSATVRWSSKTTVKRTLPNSTVKSLTFRKFCRRPNISSSTPSRSHSLDLRLRLAALTCSVLASSRTTSKTKSLQLPRRWKCCTK
jgi:hypothetical protein